MIITINGKIVKPGKEFLKEPPMSPWFKKWLLVIGGTLLLMTLPASFLRFDEELVLGWLFLILLCLIILFVVVILSAIVTWIKNILKFKMVIYTVEKPKTAKG